MPYQYTCPLCLDKLERGQALKVFKIADASSGSKSKYSNKRIDCGRKDFIEEILKFGGADAFVPVDEQAVYVSHDRCRAVNPFWQSTSNQISIPGKYQDGDKLEAELTCIITGNPLRKEMYHWMIKILRETLQLGNDYAPMWYPFQLLLATAAQDEMGRRKRPYGSLVEMASTKSAGKTILTLQILNQALYRNGRSLTMKDFFYPNADQDDPDFLRFTNKFYGEMFYHSMWSETPTSRPFGTMPSPGDLRAVFIQPVASDEEPAVEPVKPPSNGKFKRASRFILKLAILFIIETFRRNQNKKEEKKDSAPRLAQEIEVRKDEFWNPIIFYDTAGELQRGGGPVTRAVRQLTNKLAICIDAQEIFDSYETPGPTEIAAPVIEPNASIKHAYKRLLETAMAPQRKKATCIVVTKLDLVLSESEKQRVKSIAEGAGADEEARELLIEWLLAHNDDDKKNLISVLTKERKLVDRVFFVWTENLPRMTGVRFSPIRKIDPPSARPGEEVLIEANDKFDFDDAKKVTFNGRPSVFQIISKKQIKAIVPEGASSGLVGIRLEGVRTSGQAAPTSANYIDDATSDVVFAVKPEKGNDAAKPRSYGLVKFLAWCLDKQVKDISRPTYQ